MENICEQNGIKDCGHYFIVQKKWIDNNFDEQERLNIPANIYVFLENNPYLEMENGSFFISPENWEIIKEKSKSRLSLRQFFVFVEAGLINKN